VGMVRSSPPKAKPPLDSVSGSPLPKGERGGKHP